MHIFKIVFLISSANTIFVSEFLYANLEKNVLRLNFQLIQDPKYAIVQNISIIDEKFQTMEKIVANILFYDVVKQEIFDGSQ